MKDYTDKFVNLLTKWNIQIDDHKLDLFEMYYDLLISWNERINLTAITDKEDVYIKHFADSIAVLKTDDLSGQKMIDVGSGAGFPGIPISIMCPEADCLLIDSLNKRTLFLEEVIDRLDLHNVRVMHGRSEDLARNDDLRENFDLAVSRAVADLSVLSEYCLPFVNINGTFISYKSGIIDDELTGAGKAIDILGGHVRKVERFDIPFTDYERSLIYIDKDRHTDQKYPRKAGKPLKKPL